MLDRYGRSGGGSPDVDSFTKSLLSTTNNVIRDGNKSGDNEGMDKLYDAVNAVATEIDGSAAKELDQARRHTSEVSQLHKELRSLNQTESTASKENKSQGTNLKSLEYSMRTLLSEAKKQNTLWVGVSKFGNRGYTQMVRAIKEAIGKGSSAARSGGGGGRGTSVNLASISSGVRPPSGGNVGGGNRGGGGSNSGGGDGGGGVGNVIAPSASWNGVILGLTAAGFQLSRVASSLINAFDLNLGKVFDGLIRDENIFKENMRQIVYQTQGLTGANRELEKSAMDIDNIVMRTGYNRSEFQKMWVENMQKGFKIQNAGEAKEMKTAKGREKLMKRHVSDMKNITIQALHTSKQTGISADNLNEMFTTMQFGMGMTTNQVHIVARGMKSIARDMGLTGDNLAKAMANAQKLLQKMADAGVLTAEAAEGVNRTMAAAAKHGVEGFTEKLISATTSIGGYRESDQSTKALLMRAAAKQNIPFADLTSGKAQSDEVGQRKLMQGTSDVIWEEFSRFGGNLRGKGVSEDAIKAKDLSSIIQQLNENGYAQTVNTINMGMKGRLGMEAGEAGRALKAFAERTMSYSDRIKIIDDDLSEANANGNIAAAKELKSRKAGTEADMFLKVGRNIMDIKDANKGISEKDLQEKLAKRMSGHFMGANDTPEQGLQKAQEYIADMAKNSQNAMGGLNVRVNQLREQGSFIDVEKIFSKIGPDLGFNSMEELKKGLTTGDKDAFAALDAIDQAISDEERAFSDPMTGMRKELHEINEWLRGGSATILQSIGTATLRLVQIVGSIFAIMTTLSVAGHAIRGARGLFNGARGFFGGGSGGGTGGGGTGGGGTGGGGGWFGRRSTPSTMSPPHGPHGPTTPHGPTASGRPLGHRSMSANDRLNDINRRRVNSGRSQLGRSDVRSMAGRGTYRPTKGRFGRILGMGRSIFEKGGNLLAKASDYARPLADMADMAQDVGMSPQSNGFEGFGDNVVPVFVTNWGDMGSGINGALSGGPSGGGMGLLGDLAYGASDVMDLADLLPKKGLDKVDDIARAAKGLDKVDDIARAAKGIDKVDDVAKSVGFLGKAKGVGTGVMEKGSGMLTSIGSKIPGASKLSGLGSKSMGLLKGAGSVANKGAGPLALLTGGIFGAMEAEEAGRTKTEGAIYGALTGGAKRGSMFSGLVGAEEGSTADDLLGIAGAAGTGALTGAAIGSAIPVVGTAVGAAVGGVIGAGAEMAKVFTDPESKLRKSLVSLGETAWEGTKDLGSSLVGGISSTAGSIASSAGAFASKLNPFSWFKGEEKSGVVSSEAGESGLLSKTGGGLLGLATGGLLGGGLFAGVKKMLFDSSEEISSDPKSINEILALISEGIKTLVEINAAILGAFNGDTVNEAMSKGILEKVNKSDISKLGENIKESTIEGAREAEKEFGQQELLTFISKDIGRIRESLTGEYSAMSDALMDASNTSEKVVEAAAKELGALSSGEVGDAQSEAIFSSIKSLESGKSEESSLVEKIANLWGHDKYQSASDKFQQGDIFGGALDFGKATVDQMFGPMDEILVTAFNGIEKAFGFGKSSMKDLGAFSGSETKEASNLGTNALISAISGTENNHSPLSGKLMSGGVGVAGILQSIYNLMSSWDSSSKNLIGDASTTNLGAFEKFQSEHSSTDEDSIREQVYAQGRYGTGVNEIHRMVQALNKDSVYDNADTSLAKSMYYDLMGGEGNDFWKWITESFTGKAGGVNPNSMDYTDVIKGQVSTKMMSDQQLENAVASRLMTAHQKMSSGNEERTDASDTELFKMMVHFLKTIAENTTPEQYAKIVGNSKFGVPTSRQSGIKNSTRDKVSGFWNLQSNQNSAGTVGNDGRGSK